MMKDTDTYTQRQNFVARLKKRARKNPSIHRSESYSVMNVGWVVHNNGNPHEGMMDM